MRHSEGLCIDLHVCSPASALRGEPNNELGGCSEAAFHEVCLGLQLQLLSGLLPKLVSQLLQLAAQGNHLVLHITLFS